MDGTYDYKYYRVISANIAVNLHVPDKKQFRIEEEHADTCVIAAKYRMKIEMCNLMNHDLLVSILRFHSRFIFAT